MKAAHMIHVSTLQATARSDREVRKKKTGINNFFLCFTTSFLREPGVSTGG